MSRKTPETLPILRALRLPPDLSRLIGMEPVTDHSYVELKGHRKALGRLRLRFDALEFVDCAGQALPSPLPFRT